MPYSKIQELPNSVVGVLPEHAQEIFIAAYNHAWDEYADPAKREGGRGHEETAFAVAWGAVKQLYEKSDSGHWIKKRPEDR